MALLLAPAMALAADITPPADPGGNRQRFDGMPVWSSNLVVATSLDPGSVTVHWWPAVDEVGVREHCVVRAPGQYARPADFAPVGCIEGASEFVDRSVAAGELYSYGVHAVDHAGNASRVSDASGHDAFPRVLAAGMSRSLTLQAPLEVAPGATIAVNRRIECNPPCNLGHNDLHATMDIDIPYLTDPRLTGMPPGSWSASPFRVQDFTFSWTAPARTGVIYLYPEAHFGAVNGWNPEPGDDFDQGLAGAWVAIRVSAGTPLDVVPAALPDADGGTPYRQALAASGESTAPFTFGVAHLGRLPEGLALAGDGTLAGTPRQLGTWSFTVRVEDHDGRQAARRYDLRVRPADPSCQPAPVERLYAVRSASGLDVELSWIAQGAAVDGYNVWKVADRREIPHARRGERATPVSCSPAPIERCTDAGAVAAAAGPLLHYNAIALCDPDLEARN